MKKLEEAIEQGQDLLAPLNRVISAGIRQSDPRLLSILAPYAGRIAGLAGFKTLKKSLRAQASGVSKPEGGQPSDLVPSDWAFFSLTRGKQAVILGGDPRPHAAQRVQDAFGFSAVVWEETDPRRVGALAERVRSNSLDLIILLRGFIAHREGDTMIAAARAAKVPYVLVDTGYGVSQIRLAIERYMRVLVRSSNG